MSSDDRKDHGPIWPGSVPPWDQSSEPEEGMPENFADEGQQMASLPSPIPFVEAEGDPVPQEDEREIYNSPLPAPEQDIMAPDSFLQQVWYYVKLFLFPLLFGCASALLVLPPIASGRAYLPSLMLWPMLMLIFLIVVGQACAVYYTSSLPHVWLLGTLGSLAVLALIGTFAVFGPWPGALLLLVVIVLAAYLVRRVFHPVPEGYVDIVFVQGKYRRTLAAGFNLLLPWEQVFEQVNIEETHWLCPPQRVQLSPEEDVILRALISYQVDREDAYLTVTSVNHWQESLREVFVTTIHTVATAFKPDDFLSWPQSLHTYQERRQFSADDFTGTPERRVTLNNELFVCLRDRCASWGVQINWVNLRNIELVPHGFPVLETELGDSVNPVARAAETDEPTEILPPGTVTPAPATASGSASPAREEQALILNAETLAILYKAVQTGKITDITAIRDIAASFETMARDAQASDAADFDAARAAQNLYEQARRYEERQQSKTFHDEKTQPELGAGVPSGPLARK